MLLDEEIEAFLHGIFRCFYTEYLGVFTRNI